MSPTLQRTKPPRPLLPPIIESVNLKSLSTLQIALGVSFVVHAAVLTVRIVDPEGFNRVFEDTPLEVVLVNARSNEKVDKAQAIAQAALAGGGEAEKGRATSPLPPSALTAFGDAAEDEREHGGDWFEDGAAVAVAVLGGLGWARRPDHRLRIERAIELLDEVGMGNEIGEEVLHAARFVVRGGGLEEARLVAVDGDHARRGAQQLAQQVDAGLHLRDIVTLDDILIEHGRIASFRVSTPTHTAMGRFGNVMFTGRTSAFASNSTAMDQVEELLAADAPLLALHEEAGARLGGPLAVPQLAAIARLAAAPGRSRAARTRSRRRDRRGCG